MPNCQIASNICITIPPDVLRRTFFRLDGVNRICIQMYFWLIYHPEGMLHDFRFPDNFGVLGSNYFAYF